MRKLALGDYSASLMADVLSHLPKRKHFTQKHVAENAENQPPARRESLIEQELALSLSSLNKSISLTIFTQAELLDCLACYLSLIWAHGTKLTASRLLSKRKGISSSSRESLDDDIIKIKSKREISFSSLVVVNVLESVRVVRCVLAAWRHAHIQLHFDFEPAEAFASRDAGRAAPRTSTSTLSAACQV